MEAIQPLQAVHAPTADSSAGVLTAAFLDALREAYRMSPADRACHNAVTNNAVKALALDRGLMQGEDGHFSHRVQSKGITNQKKSGRCWMFAGLNVLRPQVMRDHRIEQFEFSTAYLQFWDCVMRISWTAIGRWSKDHGGRRLVELPRGVGHQIWDHAQLGDANHFHDKAEVLPAWYPGAMTIQSSPSNA